jgi:hypothetical protein
LVNKDLIQGWCHFHGGWMLFLESRASLFRLSCRLCHIRTRWRNRRRDFSTNVSSRASPYGEVKDGLEANNVQTEL